MIARSFAYVAVVGSLGAVSVLAQGDAATTHRGELLMRADAQVGEALPVARQRAALVGADKIAVILERDDALANPVGYSVVLHRATGVTTLVAVDTPDGEPLMEINAAFFETAVDGPQVVTVCLPGLQSDVQPTRYEWNEQRRHDAALVRDHLDWSAIEAVVRP